MSFDHLDIFLDTSTSQLTRLERELVTGPRDACVPVYPNDCSRVWLVLGPVMHTSSGQLMLNHARLVEPSQSALTAKYPTLDHVSKLM